GRALLARLLCTILPVVTQGPPRGSWTHHRDVSWWSLTGVGHSAKAGGQGWEATALQLDPSLGERLDMCAARAHLSCEHWAVPGPHAGARLPYMPLDTWRSGSAGHAQSHHRERKTPCCSASITAPPAPSWLPSIGATTRWSVFTPPRATPRTG